MAIVYRIENKQGRGLYCGGGMELLNYSSIANDHQPIILRDRKIGHYFRPGLFGGIEHDLCWVRMHYGFANKKQLHTWLPNHDDLKKLDENGWRIGVYDCPEALLGDTQAVFNPETAKRLRRTRLVRKTKKCTE